MPLGSAAAEVVALVVFFQVNQALVMSIVRDINCRAVLITSTLFW